MTDDITYRVEIEPRHDGKYSFSVRFDRPASYHDVPRGEEASELEQVAIDGWDSTEPLLDACREIKRMGGDTGAWAGLFRKGRSTWDARCKVGWGATHTVEETKGGRQGFRRWHPRPKTVT